jgi:hypothetical protein
MFPTTVSAPDQDDNLNLVLNIDSYFGMILGKRRLSLQVHKIEPAQVQITNRPHQICSLGKHRHES